MIEIKVLIAEKTNILWELGLLQLCTAVINSSQGNKERVSTGSQNQKPPQPISLYAHQLPKPIPKVERLKAKYNHGLKSLTKISKDCHEQVIEPVWAHFSQFSGVTWRVADRNRWSLGRELIVW